MIKRNILGIMGGVIMSSVLLLSLESHGAGTNPVPMTPIQSQGTYVFDGDGSNDVKIYASDIINLHNELNNLGIYTDSKLTTYNTNIDTLESNVVTRKNTIKDRINYYKSGTITATDPTYVQLESGIGTVYTTGYNYGKSNTNPSTGTNSGSASNDEVKNISYTVPSSANGAYATCTIYNGFGTNNNYGLGTVTVGGSTVKTGWGFWSGSVGAGKTINIKLENKDGEGTMYGNIYVVYW